MGGCSDLVLRLCRACLPLEEVGVLSWDYGALGMPLSRIGQGVTKRKRHSVFRYGGVNVTVTQGLRAQSQV